MSSNFPNGPDTITNNVDNTTPEFNIHPPLHNQLADSIMAVQTSLLAGGSLSLADHKSAADPHPVYLTQAEGDARYTPVGGGLSLPLTQNLTFSPDNTFDIGASGANRPRNIFVAGSLTAPQLWIGNSDIGDGRANFFGNIILQGNVWLYGEAASILAQRNGTNPQTLRLYNTYIDASNYQRASIMPVGAHMGLLTENAGTGAATALYVGTTGGQGLYLRTQNIDRWFVSVGGAFVANADNTYDIGANGANRARNVYAASGIYTAMNTAAQGPAIYGGSGVPAAGLGANGDVFHRSDTPATSLQRIYVKSAGAWVGIV